MSEDGTGLLEVDDDEVSILGQGNRIAGRFRDSRWLLTDAPDESLAPVVALLRAAGAGARSDSKYCSRSDRADHNRPTLSPSAYRRRRPPPR